MDRAHLPARTSAPLIWALLLAALASGCVSQQVKKVGSTQAQYAQAEVPPEALLQVAIVTFDPGIPDTIKAQEKNNVIPAVREAEAKYLPHVLRDTLQNTGYWGAVRVVPAAVNTAEVTVRGTILESDGEVYGGRDKGSFLDMEPLYRLPNFAPEAHIQEVPSIVPFVTITRIHIPYEDFKRSYDRATKKWKPEERERVSPYIKEAAEKAGIILF